MIVSAKQQKVAELKHDSTNIQSDGLPHGLT